VSNGTYEVEITEAAVGMLQSVTDKRIRGKLAECVGELADNPELQGSPLVDDLSGYRSVRAVGQRYRIIYRVDHDNMRVIVVAVGIRKEGDKKDIYKLAQKLWSRGELP
jgi:mRNA interferase RelE/StbE